MQLSRISACLDVTDVPALECEALVVVYTSTDGANWYHKENWLTGTAVDAWYGVTVSAGHVTVLNLTENNLTGSLPAELGDLTGLVNLYMALNQLSGSIPT